jgi:D-glycero-D-manno-heptose 1,7-bisphosphate phosphatase
MTWTIFLDRDGVINAKQPEGSYVTSWEEVDVLPGAEDAIAALTDAGCRVIVVTNQRGIARGKTTMSKVEKIHRNLALQIADRGGRIDAFYFCPDETGPMRKPEPGMLLKAAEEYPEIDFDRSFMIGDSLSDMRAGDAAGCCCTILVGSGQRQVEALSDAHDLRLTISATAPDLATAVERIVLPAINDAASDS